MAKRHPAVLVGLDLGTSKAAVIIALVNKGSVRVIGVGESLTSGMQRGSITDINSAAVSIRQALERAEKMANVKATAVYVSYNGTSISIKDCHIALAAGNHAGANKGNSAVGRRRYGEIIATEIHADEKILVAIPPNNILNFLKPGLEPEARVITTVNRNIENIIESARLAGLVVQDIVYSPLAAAEALLSRAEREFGTLLVDMGYAATTVSIFERDLIRETAILAVGGEHLAGDLAIGLRTSMADAGEILKKYHNDGKDGEGYVEIAGADGKVARKVPNDIVSSIIEARMQEILEMVAGVVEEFNYPGELPGGAVLYGGVAQLDGLLPLSENILRLKVRVGSLKDVGRDLGPRYVNAFGLVKYGSARCVGGKAYGGVMDRVFGWFQNKLKHDNNIYNN
ncbi:MAG: Cell division protein FtsA [Pelotomaculum sp. PtaU1.Bin035]|nr:MAG: Cell division protein FtsA [Pelotomaculum sp. PtaU1.Bin035]